jgi:hypothetical protein
VIAALDEQASLSAFEGNFAPKEPFVTGSFAPLAAAGAEPDAVHGPVR